MDRHVISVQADSSLAGMIDTLKDRQAAHVVVLRGERPVGMFTERDLIRILRHGADRSRPVGDSMSTPAITVPASLGLKSGYVQLCLSRLRHLIVTDEAAGVAGVAAECDFIAPLATELRKGVTRLDGLVEPDVPTLAPTTPIKDAVDRMVREKRGCVVAAEAGRPVGLFTDHQAPLALARQEREGTLTLADAMRGDMTPIAPGAEVAAVIDQLAVNRLGYLPVVDDRGAVSGVISQSRLLERVRTDIQAEVAARQLAEDKLRRAEARLKATLELTPTVAVQWFDAGGRIQYWNHASELTYGWAAAEVLNKTLDQLILSAEEAARFTEVLREVARTGKAIGPMQCLARDRHGRQRWIESTAFPIPGDDSGTLVACMGIDVTEREQAGTQLRQLATAVEQSPESIVITSLAGDIEYVNEAFVTVTGYSRGEVIGRNPRILHSGRTPRQTFIDLWGSLGRGEVWSGEFCNRRKDGSDYVERAIIGPIRRPDGRVSHYVAVKSDITEAKSQEETLRRASMYVRSLIEASLDPLVTIDSRGRITDVNQATETVTGRGRAELIGSDFCDYFTEPERARVGYQRVFSQGSVTDYPLAIRHVDGGITEVLYNASVYRNQRGKVEGVFAAARDVTELKRMEAELRELATTDYLTNLANRRHYMACLSEQLTLLRRNVTTTTSVLMLDVDHFKRVNDSYGHSVGDLLLRHIAGLLREGRRNIDVVGRIGGEEFSVLLPGTDLAGARTMAERLRQAIETTPLQHGGQIVPVTVSIGISLMSAADNTPDCVLIRADQALYLAKERGRNRVVTAPPAGAA
nr:PAS domain S-box protein [Parasulfuritortus cantonensis]